MKKRYTAVIIFFLLHYVTTAQPPAISYQLITSGLFVPVDILNAGDGTNRLFIVEQQGIIKVWNGTTLSNFIDLQNQVSYQGERGLLSMAFHPGYNGTTNRYFFVYYTDIYGDIAVKRYQTAIGNINKGDSTSGTPIITIPHGIYMNHNGGKLNFGRDGYLYFATGDGGGGNDAFNHAQDPQNLLGKMLRIDIDQPGPPEHPYYSIPPDNPYAANTTVKGEIWAFGLRNPFRWSFDRLNGDMWIGDVGESAREEVDYRKSGTTGNINYGWHCYEGSIPTAGVSMPCPLYGGVYVAPVYEIIHDASVQPNYVVTGGFVYRGPDYPNFRGYYIASEFYSGMITLLWPNGSGGFNFHEQHGLTGYISAFGEGEDGTLYALSMVTNSFYKVVATGGTPLPITLTSFTAHHYSTYNELKWSIAEPGNLHDFVIQSSVDAKDFSTVGKVPVSTGNDYKYFYRDITSATAPLYYRLGMEDRNGTIQYSSVQKVPGSVSSVKIYPSVITNGVLNISLPTSANMLQLVDINGAVVFKQNLTGNPVELSLKLPQLAKGMYTVNILMDKEVKTSKIVIQ
jgi:glucose/arabinose dehydrogenase